MKSADIVIAEYFPNSAKVLAPIARLLTEQAGLQVAWLAARDQVREALVPLGIRALKLEELAPGAFRKSEFCGSRFRRQLGNALLKMPAKLCRGTGALAGEKLLLPALRDALCCHLQDADHWLSAFREAFEKTKPRCVASTSYSSTVGRAAAVAARSVGARSVFVQHGLIPDQPAYAHFCHDLLLVWGALNQRTALRCGVSEERVHVVGSPIYDDLAHVGTGDMIVGNRSESATLQIAFLPSRTAGLVVSFALARRCMHAVLAALDTLSDAELFVKAHPGDRTGFVPQAVRDVPRCTLVERETSQAVIRRTDIVIVVSSTTGLEACMAGKPLIVLRTTGVAEWIAYQEYGAAIEISLDEPHAVERIVEAIRSIREDAAVREKLAEGRRRLIDDMLNGGRGDSIRLVAQLISEQALPARAPNLAVQTSTSGTNK